MTERITQARLRRLRAACRPELDRVEETAILELRTKLAAMRTRLQAQPVKPSQGSGRGTASQSQTVEAVTTEIVTRRLEQAVNDPTTPDHVLEEALHDLRIAQLHELLLEAKTHSP